jgi:uncharacterized membrane protein YjfL (UPF0719 family)
MAWTPLVIGLAELLLTAVLGLLVAYATFALLARLTRGVDEEKELSADNRAVAVVVAGTLLGVGFIVREAVYPIVALVQDAVLLDDWSASEAATRAAYGLLFVAIVLVCALGALLLALWIFTRLTRGIDERAEIKRGNVSVAIVVAALTLVLAWFIAQGAGNLTRALIPSPPLPDSPAAALQIPAGGTTHVP